MKTLIVPLALVTLLFIISCTSSGGDEKMITGINPDGSCYKEFEIEGDSAFMVGDTVKSNRSPVFLDSTWKVSWTFNTPEIHHNWPLKSWTWPAKYETNALKVKLRRDYKSVQDMAVNFKLSAKHKWKMKPSYSLDKKFRWFYTYYTYKEIYPKIKTLDRIPMEKYFTKEEAEYWFNGKLDLIKGLNGMEIKEASDELEDKFNTWFGHNFWDEEYEILVKNYDLLKNSRISKERLIVAKDSVLKKNLGKFNMIKDDFDFGNCLDDYFKTKAFSKVYKSKDNPLKQFEDKFGDREFMRYFEGSMDYRLVMPGELIQSPNTANHNDTLEWNLTAYRMVYSDFEIMAQSRKANKWAFIVAGIIGLLAIGSFFIKRK